MSARDHLVRTPLATSIVSLVALTTGLLVHGGSQALAALDDVKAEHSHHRTVPEFARTVRAIEREHKLLRQQTRQEIRQAEREERELRQERRERAQERAARVQQRQFGHWVWPISGASMSASFGEAGSSWSSGYHTGQDFTAPYGTSVVAASGGTVTFAGWGDAYGNKIEITHPDGNQTWYAHLSSLKRTSGTVQPGEVIGSVGCTGNCYGNHLHFEFHPGGGAAADPIAWLREHGVN